MSSAPIHIINEPFVLTSTKNDPINGNLRYRPRATCQPVVLVVHGFKGFKDWGFFPYICERFAQYGAFTFNFNFSLNGVRESVDIFDDLEGFAHNTISQEVADLTTILEAMTEKHITKNEEFRQYWDGRIFLLGHSRGAGVSLLVARQWSSAIEKLALWAGISRFDRFTSRQKEQWHHTGVFESVNTRTKQLMSMNVSYLNDIEKNAEKFALTTAISQLSLPALIVHGEQDMTVPVAEADVLATAAQNATVHIIPKTGHTFGAVHPFAGTTPALEEAVQTTRAFFGL